MDKNGKTPVYKMSNLSKPGYYAGKTVWEKEEIKITAATSNDSKRVLEISTKVADMYVSLVLWESEDNLYNSVISMLEVESESTKVRTALYKVILALMVEDPMHFVRFISSAYMAGCDAGKGDTVRTIKNILDIKEKV